MGGYCNGIACKIAPGGICRTNCLPFIHVLLAHYTRPIPTLYENQFQELNDNDPAAQCQLGRYEIAIGNRVNPSRPLDNGGKQKQLLYLVHYSNRLLSLSHLFLLANCLAALLLLCSYIHTLPSPPTRTGTTIIALSHRYTNTDSHAIRHQRLHQRNAFHFSALSYFLQYWASLWICSTSAGITADIEMSSRFCRC